MNDISNFHAGDIIETIDDSILEVMLPSEDGEWLLARYLRPDDIARHGPTELVHRDELRSLVPASS